jgi:hypothetical protein
MKNLKYGPVFERLCFQNCIHHILNEYGCKNSMHLMLCPVNFSTEKNYISENNQYNQFYIKRQNSRKQFFEK